MEITIPTNIKEDMVDGVYQGDLTITDSLCDHFQKPYIIDGVKVWITVAKFPIWLTRIKEVTGYFSCNNINLIDLQTIPEIIGKWVSISNCEYLESLNGLPENVGQKIYITNCPNVVTEEISETIRKKIIGLPVANEILKENILL